MTGMTSRASSGPASLAGGRLGLAVLLTGSTLTVLAGAVLTPVVELLATEARLGATAAGLVVTVHGASLALTAPVAGRAVDRWGVRRPLAAGLLLYGVAGGAGLVVDSFPVLIAIRLLFGVGAAFVFTGTTVGLLDLGGTGRDRMMGWRSAAISLGGVAWPLLGGVLGALSWQAPFAVYLLGIPLALLTWRMPDPPRPGAPGRRAGMAGLFTGNPMLPLVYAVQCVATMLLYAVLVFLPLRLADAGVTHTAVVAVFSASLSIAMSGAAFGYARLAARLDQMRLVRYAFAIWTVSLLALAVRDDPVLMLAAAVLFGLGMGIAVPALTVLTADHAPGDRRGQAAALLATAGFAGQSGSPLLFGPLHTATASVPATFLAAAALAGATVTVLLAVRRRAGRGPG